MCRLCWTLLAVAVLACGGLIYKFVVLGSVITTSDGRAAIALNEGERDLVLAEMRAFLISVQQINRGVSENDVAMVAEYARKAGRAAQANVPATLMARLPLGFKTMGLDTHQAFDQLAMDAEEFGDRDQVLSSLTTLMNNCVACHAAYRIEVERGR
jgi:cytochrome c556